LKINEQRTREEEKENEVSLEIKIKTAAGMNGMNFLPLISS
jgi:hypothetical protein